MKIEKLNFLGKFSIKPRHVTYHLGMLQRAQCKCNVKMSNLYILKAHSNVYAYNLETVHLSAK